MLKKLWLGDVRLFQIILLGSLLLWGAIIHDFSLSTDQIFLTLGAGLATQALFCRAYGLPLKSLLSATITCFGVILLLRSNTLWVQPLAAFLSIGSKYLLKWKGRHLFNPSALGIVVILLFLDNAWLSPGQWGYGFMQGAWLVVLGSLAVTRSKIWEISFLFLLFYLGGLALRNYWLGYEWTIFFRATQNGALLLFAFFMISDPKTSADHFIGKAMQAGLVAMGALCFHFYFYKTNGFIYCLILSSFLVPWFNSLWQAPKYKWRSYGSIQPV